MLSIDTLEGTSALSARGGHVAHLVIGHKILLRFDSGFYRYLFFRIVFNHLFVLLRGCAACSLGTIDSMEMFGDGMGRSGMAWICLGMAWRFLGMA